MTAMRIENQLKITGDDNLSTEFDHVFLAVHLEHLLKTAKATRVKEIDMLRYKSDLISYMLHLNIPENMHYAVMRMSGMNTYLEFGPGIEILYIPDMSEYSKLINIHKQVTG